MLSVSIMIAVGLNFGITYAEGTSEPLSTDPTGSPTSPPVTGEPTPTPTATPTSPPVTGEPTPTPTASPTVSLLRPDEDNFLRYGEQYVCDDYFGENEARMVCLQLGKELQWYHVNQYTPDGSSNYGLDNLDCPEGATNLDDCGYTYEHNCFSHEAVRIGCTEGASPSTLGAGEASSDSDDEEVWTYSTSGSDGMDSDDDEVWTYSTSGSDGMATAAIIGILFVTLLIVCLLSICAYMICFGAAATIVLLPCLCCCKDKEKEKGVTVKERTFTEEFDQNA